MAHFLRGTVIVVSLLLSLAAFASADSPLNPYEVCLRYDWSGQKIELSISLTKDYQHISEISFVLNGKNIPVPKTLYADLSYPYLDTVQLLSTPPSPFDEQLGGGLEISFAVRNYDDKMNSISTTVSIFYYYKKGQFLKRSIWAKQDTGLVKSSEMELKP